MFRASLLPCSARFRSAVAVAIRLLCENVGPSSSPTVPTSSRRPHTPSALYAEGVADQSPGFAAQAAYPGNRRRGYEPTPKGLQPRTQGTRLAPRTLGFGLQRLRRKRRPLPLPVAL